MALSIGVTLNSKITVGPALLLVREVIDGVKVLIDYAGKSYTITDKERTEVSAGVFISCGNSKPRKNDTYSRLAFEAPKSVRIQRVPA